MFVLLYTIYQHLVRMPMYAIFRHATHLPDLKTNFFMGSACVAYAKQMVNFDIVSYHQQDVLFWFSLCKHSIHNTRGQYTPCKTNHCCTSCCFFVALIYYSASPQYRIYTFTGVYDAFDAGSKKRSECKRVFFFRIYIYSRTTFNIHMDHVQVVMRSPDINWILIRIYLYFEIK